MILFAHGARDPAWAAPFEAVATRVRARRPQWHVVLAYLELMTPDLPHAAAALVQAGCRRIRIVPMFLGSGGHVRRDLPALVQQLRDRHAGIEWSLHAAIGEHPDVIEAMAQAALADTPDPPRKTMNLHQFRFVQEAVRRNLNLTETAKALFTSQPGISKAIIELEEELGVDIFARHGKRLRRITEPGQLVLKSVEVIMREVANLKRIGEEYSKQDTGTLSIATTHTQARYFLPEPVAVLRKRYPKVQVALHQGTPAQVAQHAAGRLGRHRPGHRVARRCRRSDHAALLRVAARGGGAGIAIHWQPSSGPRSSSSCMSR